MLKILGSESVVYEKQTNHDISQNNNFSVVLIAIFSESKDF